MNFIPEQVFHPATLVSAAAVITYVALFGFLYKQSRTREHFAFLFYLGTMVIWSLGSFMTRSALIGSPLFWNQVQLLGILGLPLPLYIFANAYITRKKPTETSLFILAFLIIGVLTFGGKIISSVHVEGGQQSIVMGDAAFVLVSAGWWLGLTFYSIFVIYRAYLRSTDDLERRRSKFLLVNFFIIILGVFTNGTAFGAYPVDIAANVIAAFILAYAIYRHQFLDFRFVLRSGLIYLIPTTLIAAGYFLVLSLATRLVGSADSASFYFVALLTAITAALVTQPLRERAQLWVDKAFYRDSYNPATLLEIISAATSTVIDLHPLSQLIVDEIAESMHLDQAMILVEHPESKHYEMMACSCQITGRTTFVLNQRHPIPRYLSSVKAILSREDFDIIPQLVGVSDRDIDELRSKKINRIIPLKSDEQLIGLLALGEKKSGADLNQRDTQTLLAIANQISVAIERAKNFHTAQQSLTREQLLHDATKTISQDLELDFVLDSLVEQAAAAIQASGGLVLFFEKESQSFSIQNNLNIPRALVDDFFKEKISLAENAVRQERSVIDVGQAESYLVVPLQSTTETYGAVVLFQSNQGNPFNQKDQRLTESIARQAGVAIQKARLFEETKAALLKERQLNELAKLLNKGFDIEQLLLRFADQSARVLQADTAILAIEHAHEPKNNRVTYYNLPLGLETADPKQFERYWLSLTQLAQPVISHAPDHPHTPQDLVACGVNSLVAIPFGIDEHMRGSLSLLRLDGLHKFTRRDLEVADAIANQASSSIRNALLFSELENAYLQTVTALANAIDARDEYTNGHSQRIALLAGQTAYEIGFSEDELINIHWAAKLHDIGKIGIPDDILNKPGPLTEEEWVTMRRHPQVGADIIDPVKKLGLAATMVRSHHEQWNGSGYPDALAHEDIPMGARILSVVDAFVAMTDDRVYRERLSFHEATAELEACAGTQFDPAVVDVFLNKVLIKPEILQQFGSELQPIFN